MAKSKAQKKLGGPKTGDGGFRQAKVDAVAEVTTKVQGAAAVVLTEYRGMTVGELAELREGLRKAGAEYKVYKNTLARIATKELGLPELEEHLQGPTAFTFAQGDPVEAAKALAEFAKRVQALVLKAGVLDGRILSPAEVTQLAELDSREVMLAKAAGMFQQPLARAAGLFAAGFQQLGAALAQLREKTPAEAAPAEAAPAEAAEPPAEAASEAAPAEAETPAPSDEPAGEASESQPEASAEGSEKTDETTEG